LSATLTTPALDRRSLRWFETSPCRAIPGGQTPITDTAPIGLATILYIVPFLSFVAHSDTVRSATLAGGGRALPDPASIPGGARPTQIGHHVSAVIPWR